MTEPLVGWHHGRTMTLDEIADHNKRWTVVEPEARLTVEHLDPGSLAADMLNEIDRLRLLLTERQQAEPAKPGMVADDCGWCRDHGYTAGQQLTYEGVPAAPKPPADTSWVQMETIREGERPR